MGAGLMDGRQVRYFGKGRMGEWLKPAVLKTEIAHFASASKFSKSSCQSAPCADFYFT